MHLKEQLRAEMLQAMKNHQKQRLSSIRMINAAIKQQEIDSQTELNDQGVISILVKLQKQHADSIEQFQNANRQDLVDHESAQLSVVESFLPQPLTEAEVSLIINSAIAELTPSGLKDMGLIMGHVKEELAGKADMKAVSLEIKQKLSAL